MRQTDTDAARANRASKSQTSGTRRSPPRPQTLQTVPVGSKDALPPLGPQPGPARPRASQLRQPPRSPGPWASDSPKRHQRDPSVLPRQLL